MTLKIELSPEKYATLESQAQVRGLSIEQWIVDLVELAERNIEASTAPQRKINNLSDLLLNSPFAGSELDLERAKDYPRLIDLS